MTGDPTPEPSTGGPRMSGPECDDCGQVHPGCSRHNNRGQPCGNKPKRGTTVCTAPSHGGRLPRVKAAAERNVAEAEVAAAARELAPAAPITDALAALAQLAGEVVAWKDTARTRVEALEEKIRYTAEGVGSEQLRAEVAVFERALDRCDRVLGRIAGLDIDNRLARISEQQARTVARILVTALTAAGVTGTPLQEAKAVLGRELRAVS